jgi:hypothetical protein
VQSLTKGNKLSPLLDLSNAKESSFEAIDSGVYPAEVFEVKMTETKGATESNPDAALPKGTPMLNVQFRIVGDAGTSTESEESAVYNRRVFKTYIIAPEKVGGKKYEHKEMMDGQLLKFFKDIGYTEEEVKSGNFDPDFDDMKGRSCRVTVGQRTYNNEVQNEVKGTKPAGEGSEGSGLL